MPHQNPPRPSGRLGTQMRGALSDEFHARRHQANDLIYTYSPRMDADVVLKSSLEYAHFLLVESDPCIVRADYSPAQRVARLCGEGAAAIVDAEVTNIEGEIIWREIKYFKSRGKFESTHASLEKIIQADLADGLADNLQILTENEIYLNPIRIRNWNRIVPWIAQCREFNLDKKRHTVLLLIKKRKKLRFSEILEIGEISQAGLYAAAIFKEVQVGSVASDLNEAPLSRHSVFFQQEGKL